MCCWRICARRCWVSKAAGHDRSAGDGGVSRLVMAQGSSCVVGLCGFGLLPCAVHGPSRSTRKAMSIAAPVMKSFLLAATVSGRTLAGLVFVMLASAIAAQSPVAASSSRQGGDQAAATSPAVVGVIDIAQAIDQYKVHIDLRAKLKTRYESFQQEVQGAMKQIEELRVTIQNISEAAPERVEAEHQYKMALQNQDFRRKYFNDLLRVQETRLMLEVFEDLDFAVAKVAEKRGVTIVLPKRDIVRSPVPIADMQIDEVDARVNAFQNRTVWFAAKEVDMTGDVIKYMMAPLPDRSSPERAPAPVRQPSNTNGGGSQGANNPSPKKGD